MRTMREKDSNRLNTWKMKDMVWPHLAHGGELVTVPDTGKDSGRITNW